MAGNGWNDGNFPPVGRTAPGLLLLLDAIVVTVIIVIVLGFCSGAYAVVAVIVAVVVVTTTIIVIRDQELSAFGLQNHFWPSHTKMHTGFDEAVSLVFRLKKLIGVTRPCN